MRLFAALMTTIVVVVQASWDDEQNFAGQQEPVQRNDRQRRALHWNLEESLERLNIVDHLVEKLPDSPLWPHRDTFAEYDHGLMQEHMPLGPGHHSRFYVAGAPQSL